MCSLLRYRCALLTGLAIFCLASAKGEIVINEIMFQPPSGKASEEYIELYNLAPTNVNLTGWALRGGIDFVFPSNTVINARGFLTVAANKTSFLGRYGNVSPLVGDWAIVRVTELGQRLLTNYANVLGNTRNTVNLKDATGETVDTVPYADEGDWAVRQRGVLDYNHRGWTWSKPADGMGSSLELRNPNLPNEFGQNWSASASVNGTPGAANSVFSTNVPPLILNVAHFPIVPNSSEPVRISARIIDEQSGGLTVSLVYRIDAANPVSFSTTPMFDDGAHRDGVTGDGLYGFVLPAMPDNTIIEFYVQAVDGQGNTRTWPAPVIAAPDGAGPIGQVANALFQVDDNPANRFGGTPSLQPVYKLIMTEVERAEMATMHSTDRNSDAQMNGTFVSLDGTGAQSRYLMSIRNRGHSTRGAGNFRLGFRSDEPWNGHLALILNLVQPPLQVFGATLAIKSGAVGAYDRAAQVRVNNVNRSGSGSPTFGSYAVNEVYDSEWANRQFPNDSGGNIYRVYRDIDPSELDYRGENASSYQNTYFKENNITENDWIDLINMHSVIGLSGVDAYSAESANAVLNVEKWLTHLAVMSLMGNSESGLNSGHNDDYFLYCPANDPHFVPMFHDLDQLFGMGGQSFPDGPNDTIWGAAYIQGSPTNTYQRSTSDNYGSGRAMYRLMHTPEFEQLYYSILQRLLDTSFSKPQFDALLDQALAAWAPAVIPTIRNYMDARRSYVQGVIAGRVPSASYIPFATVAGEPRSPTPLTTATLTVGGAGISHYRYRLNSSPYSVETPVSTPIQLSGLAHGSTNTVSVIGKSTNGIWQSRVSLSRSWVVRTDWPAVRLNEVLARNESAVDHQSTFPDMIELYNEGTATVNLGGIRLTDDPSDPGRFTFASGTLLQPGSNLVVFANNPDGTPGIHVGFGLGQNGDGLYLYNSVASGGALLDSVLFGGQIADRSIGRLGNQGTWVLTQPTFGAANIVQPLGGANSLKINEWLASGQFPFSDDFVELYNPEPLPVHLGGLYLTDSPIGVPGRHRIPDLNFIAQKGFAAFIADGDTDKPDHLGFSLDADIGEIALLSESMTWIDNVFYTPQQTGVSIGRCPDGEPTNRVQSLPSPGAGNICPQSPPDPQTVVLMNWNHPWSFENSGSNLGTDWRTPDYPDGSWLTGPGLLGVMRGGGSLPETLETYVGPLNGKITFYFRTHFTLPANANFTRIQLTHIIDDGAVFYLNGNEVLRYNLPQTTISSTTLATNNILDSSYQGPTTIPLSYFSPGDNVLAVEVHQASANSADIILGLKLDGLIVTNVASQAGIVINEVFANNASIAEPDGSTPDWIELYNPSVNAVDLGGTCLGDLSGNRWTFPAGSIIPAQGYFSLRFDADLPASSTNTGFGLSSTGDLLTLYDKAPNNNMPLDTNIFGLQASDFSIGRVPSGSSNWRLTIPSIGSGNLPAALGDPTRLSINEYMALPASGDDWFEVYNPNEQPVAIGGMFFTDNLGEPTKHKIAPLSFLGAQTNAWQKFIADGNTAAGADHVNFKLAAINEAVGIADTNGVLLSAASLPPYGQQVSGISRGRFPDGGTNIVSFTNTPSPGNPNFLLMSDIVINEVLSHTDPPLEDAIELHNVSGSAVNISGWWLSDAKGTPRKFQVHQTQLSLQVNLRFSTLMISTTSMLRFSRLRLVQPGAMRFTFLPQRRTELLLVTVLSRNSGPVKMASHLAGIEPASAWTSQQ